MLHHCDLCHIDLDRISVRRGGQVLLQTEVTGFIREGDTIQGIRTRNVLTGATAE